MSVLWDLSPVMVGGHRPFITFPDVRIGQILNVITYGQHHLIRHQPFVHQIQNQKVCHLPHNQSALLKIIRTFQHLPGAHAAVIRLICLDICHGTWFPSPGMINQKLCIHTEQPVQQIFIIIIARFPHGTSGHISHGKHSIFFQFPGISPANPPEISEWTMIPQTPSVRYFVQLCNSHTILVRRHMLRADIHSNLA